MKVDARRRTPAAFGAVLMAVLASPVQAHGEQLVPVSTLGISSGPTYGEGWRPLTPIAGGPRQEHTIAALGGRVYVIGGIYADAAGELPTTNRVEVYDTRSDSWSDAAPMPIAMNHPNVAAVDGRLYVIGGLSGGTSWQALPNSYVYNPRANRWTQLPPMPDGTERGSAAVGVRGTKIYLAGGMRTLTPTPGGLQDTVSTVSSYDVVTGRWETLPSLPEGRDHVAGAIIGATFYVLGGRDRGQVNVRDTVYAFDLQTRRWTERAPMPTPRGGIASAVVGTNIYTFGGEGNPAAGSNSIFDDTQAYDTVRDRWQVLAPMAIPRHGGAAVAVGNTIYLPGGGNAVGGAPVDINDAYRP